MNPEEYVLATGEEGLDRLLVVQSVHGADTADLFHRLGDLTGKSVADLGCGVGAISRWIASEVGINGSVWGVDVSTAQIEQAEHLTSQQHIQNIRYSVASAYETGLPREAFDIVYCRFLLMHVREPERVLAEMFDLLKPGGWFVVEDGDFTTPSCLPPVREVDQVMELYRLAGASEGADFEIGKRLHNLVLKTGIEKTQARLVQPAYLRGIEKRLPLWSLEETAPYLLKNGLATQEEIEIIRTVVEQVIESENHLMTMARMTQVWGQKPARA